MIEKFDDQSGFCMADCMHKINEVIDAVNTIQKEREAERFEIQEWIGILGAVRKSVNKLETMMKNTNTVLESLVQENNIHEEQIDKLQMKLEPEKCKAAVDPFAKQRKWIGKLCRFRDKLDSKWSYSILKSVDKRISTHPFWDAEDYEWEICEPVSRDDFLLYKGDDND